MSKAAQSHQLERDVQLANQRDHFARLLHDDLCTDLSTIIQLAQPATAPSAQATVSDRFERIAQLARDLSRNARDILWAATPDHDTLTETLAKIREFAARFWQSRHGRFHRLGALVERLHRATHRTRPAPLKVQG